MRVAKRDLLDVTAKIQMDLRDAQARLVEIRAWIAALDLPDPVLVICPDCSAPLSGPNGLAEHRYHLHGGPEPEHWKVAESRLPSPVSKRTDSDVVPTDYDVPQDAA